MEHGGVSRRVPRAGGRWERRRTVNHRHRRRKRRHQRRRWRRGKQRWQRGRQGHQGRQGPRHPSPRRDARAHHTLAHDPIAHLARQMRPPHQEAMQAQRSVLQLGGGIGRGGLLRVAVLGHGRGLLERLPGTESGELRRQEGVRVQQEEGLRRRRRGRRRWQWRRRKWWRGRQRRLWRQGRRRQQRLQTCRPRRQRPLPQPCLRGVLGQKAVPVERQKQVHQRRLLPCVVAHERQQGRLP
mmetsp:Transcript_28049/g.59577  ORF Transcript_28049/g.59577 Transcript_28049/m.59577 type:complete len:240 (+) Transcript_28049:801-1520(+)